MRKHSYKKEIIRIWFQEVFSIGYTDILKEIASDDVITHFKAMTRDHKKIQQILNASTVK